MTPHEYLTEGSCEFIGGIFLQYVTTLTSLVAISIVIDFFLISLLTCCEHKFKGLCKFMGKTAHVESAPCHVWLTLVYKVSNMSRDLIKPRD